MTHSEPSLFVWTADRPTAPGWYWVKRAGIVAVLEIARGETMAGVEVLWVYGLAGGWPIYSDHLLGWQWAGPIPEPIR